MGPEEFYHFNKLNNKEYMREIRIKSFAWILDCFDRGTIKKRTITGLIAESDLIYLLKDLEIEERYEDCALVKDILDKIYTE